MTESEVQKLTTGAIQALENGRYAEAEELQRRAVALLERESVHSTGYADGLERLAGIHYHQAKFGLAAEECDRVLKSLEALEPANERVLRILYWLGKSRFNNRDYDAAEIAFRRALVAVEAQPESSRNVSRFLRELGFLMYFVGRYREAEPLLLRSLGICEELYGANHPETVWVVERIALNYEHCPELGKDPEPYYRRAAQALNPVEHKGQYVANVCRWAQCLSDAQRLEEADEVYGSLLPLIDESPEWRSDWSWIVSNCVDHFTSRGKSEVVTHLIAKNSDYDAYADLTNARLQHAERTLPDNDPEFAEALFNAGNHAIFCHKYSEAEALLRRALDSNIKAHGEVSERVVATLNRLSLATRELGNASEAEQLLQRAIKIAATHFPASEVYPRTIESLSFLRETQGRSEEAIKLFADAVAIVEARNGPKSYEKIEYLYRQSGQLLRAGRFADAEKIMRQVVETMDEAAEASDFEKADYVATLAWALEGLGRMEEAKEAGRRAEVLMDRAKKEAEND